MEEKLSHAFKEVFRLRLVRLRRENAHIGLSPGQPPILFLLRREGTRAQREIAEELCLSPASITSALVRMEKAGLVTRESDPEDLRRTKISLTEKAAALLKKCDKINKEIDKALYFGFSCEEKQRLTGYFKRMKENLTEIEAKE